MLARAVASRRAGGAGYELREPDDRAGECLLLMSLLESELVEYVESRA